MPSMKKDERLLRAHTVTSSTCSSSYRDPLVTRTNAFLVFCILSPLRDDGNYCKVPNTIINWQINRLALPVVP